MMRTEPISIPTWEDLRRVYDAKWEEEKENFHNKLKENFRQLVTQYKSGQQEIFELSEGRPIRNIMNKLFVNCLPTQDIRRQWVLQKNWELEINVVRNFMLHCPLVIID